MNPVKAGRAQDPYCEEFLAAHSEYLDGLLPPLQAARMSAHADACATCARYDRIVRKGLLLARELPEMEPTADFELRLQRRLLDAQQVDALRMRRAPVAGIVTTVGVAAAIALLAWSPVIVERSAEAPAVASTEVMETPDAVPLHVESSWYPLLPEPSTHDAVNVLAAFPGPYSPLIVTPPAHRSVRTVSSEYLPVD